MTETHRYVPVAADYLTAMDADGTYHAVWRPSPLWSTPIESVCGAEGAELAAAEAVNEAGDTLGSVVLAWPPYQADRCPVCWDQTGKPRPSHAWRNLRTEK